MIIPYVHFLAVERSASCQTYISRNFAKNRRVKLNKIIKKNVCLVNVIYIHVLREIFLIFRQSVSVQFENQKLHVYQNT